MFDNYKIGQSIQKFSQRKQDREIFSAIHNCTFSKGWELLHPSKSCKEGCELVELEPSVDLLDLIGRVKDNAAEFSSW